MLKVNAEALLNDYQELCNKCDQNRALITRAAEEFALGRCYTAECTAKFVAFVMETEGNGLNEKDRAKLEILGKYISEVEEAETSPETEVI